MRDLLLLAIHLFVTIAKLLGPGGVRAVAAESLLLKQQLIVSNRSRQRAPNLTTLDRFVLGLITLFVTPRRIPKLSRIVKSATLLKFHNHDVKVADYNCSLKGTCYSANKAHRHMQGEQSPCVVLPETYLRGTVDQSVRRG